ncbi:outer membrane protein [Aureimonas leprariae]|uniref:Porin family protein n=1 Tax=Plantimonas leprariae TaxID=2615207 RepID=A0A7V7PMI1_9HYPH|nr:outer membrane beta-barrel protein [Aureimonas leprariae]KAB0678046.1 porin family protein [Aureimonas leprariae]
MALRHILSLAFSFAGVNIAWAADPIEAQFDQSRFSGFYAGVQGGAGFFDSRFSSDVGLADGRDPNTTGGLLGAHAGYGVSLGSVYLGLEGELQGFLGSENVAGESIGQTVEAVGRIIRPNGNPVRVLTDYTVTLQERFEHDLKEHGALKARLGYELGAFMPFATGGLAVGRVETSYSASSTVTRRAGVQYLTTLPTDASAEASDTDTAVGYTVGGGLAMAVTEHLIVRGEYDYTDLGSKRYEFTFEDGTEADAKFDTRLHQAKVGISYRF